MRCLWIHTYVWHSIAACWIGNCVALCTILWSSSIEIKAPSLHRLNSVQWVCIPFEKTNKKQIQVLIGSVKWSVKYGCHLRRKQSGNKIFYSVRALHCNEKSSGGTYRKSLLWTPFKWTTIASNVKDAFPMKSDVNI